MGCATTTVNSVIVEGWPFSPAIVFVVLKVVDLVDWLGVGVGVGVVGVGLVDSLLEEEVLEVGVVLVVGEVGDVEVDDGSRVVGDRTDVFMVVLVD